MFECETGHCFKSGQEVGKDEVLTIITCGFCLMLLEKNPALINDFKCSNDFRELLKVAVSRESGLY